MCVLCVDPGLLPLQVPMNCDRYGGVIAGRRTEGLAISIGCGLGKDEKEIQDDVRHSY